MESRVTGNCHARFGTGEKVAITPKPYLSSLSLRQFIFSILACGVAVGIFFGLRNHLGTETVSWVCILGAAPFAAMGFITYHGMTAEQFAWTWIKSEILMPKRLTFKPENIYYEAVRPLIENPNKKEGKKRA